MSPTLFSGNRTRYADGDLRMLLEARVRELLAAEGAVRLAQAQLDALVASGRRDQEAIVTEALKNLADRRPCC